MNKFVGRASMSVAGDVLGVHFSTRKKEKFLWASMSVVGDYCVLNESFDEFGGRNFFGSRSVVGDYCVLNESFDEFYEEKIYVVKRVVGDYCVLNESFEGGAS